jgi:hypothetical protein
VRFKIIAQPFVHERLEAYRHFFIDEFQEMQWQIPLIDYLPVQVGEKKGTLLIAGDLNEVHFTLAWNWKAVDISNSVRNNNRR